MKLGMPILYEFSTIEENFELASKLGLDFVELNLNFGYCRKAMEEGIIKDLLPKYQLETTLHFYDEADLGSYSEVVEAYLGLLKKYVSLGNGYLKLINFHNNVGPVVTISGVKNYIYEKEYSEYIIRLLSNLKKAEGICRNAKIGMVIENVDGAPQAFFMNDVIRDENDAGFHFNYDIGHDFVSGSTLYKLVQTLPLHFDEFHFHDADATKCHLALGDGIMGDRLRSLKALASDNGAYVVLEVKSKMDLIKSVPLFRSI